MSSSKITSAAITTNLVLQILIIVTGGAVRLTASGLGCSTWPLCEPGSFTPVRHEAFSIHPYIEFGNRVISAVVVLVAIAVFLLVWRERETRSRGFRWLAAAPAIGVLAQAGVGGITVLTALHPAIVGSHFLFSAALVWTSTWLWVRWRSGDGEVIKLATPPLRSLSVALGVLTAVTVTLGMVVTGSGPHSGDKEAGYRFAVDPLWITRAHATAMWVFLAVFAVFLFIVYSRAKTDIRYRPAARGALLVLVILAMQAGLGYWQYFTGLPEGVVLAHLLGSALFILAVTYALLQLRPRVPSVSRPRPALEPLSDRIQHQPGAG